MEVGTKFKGLINGEVFEIVEITEKHNQTYYKIKHLKSNKTFEHTKRFIECLQIGILE
jgi:hypothetical protein